MTSRKSKRRRYAVGGVYLLMLAGGLWHALQVLHRTREIMAAPLLIALTVWLLYETMDDLVRQSKGRSQGIGLLVWAIWVIVFSFLIEWFGVRSGVVFGVYHYGPVLRPQIDGVPVAIGFAWLLSVMGAMTTARWLLRRRGENSYIWILLAASLLVLFDLLLEAAAVELGYWSWQDGRVPLQNYLAWFVIGAFFMLSAQAIGLCKTKWPDVIVHVFIAQALYFILIIV